MMRDDLYALWITWGGHDAQEWAALVMEGCPRTEEDQTGDAPKTEQEAQNV